MHDVWKLAEVALLVVCVVAFGADLLLNNPTRARLRVERMRGGDLDRYAESIGYRRRVVQPARRWWQFWRVPRPETDGEFRSRLERAFLPGFGHVPRELRTEENRPAGCSVEEWQGGAP